MSLYNRKEWKEFRENVIELDGSRCVRCNRGKNEATLQVHHKEYIDGKAPWEYGTEYCETLCMRCHAEEHGKIPPKSGWQYITDEDLEDLVGICQNCGTQIRYVYVVYHDKWGFMEVGTLCCDYLTDSEIASSKKETKLRYRARKTRFIKSSRWKPLGDSYTIRQSLFEVKIKETMNRYFITIHNLSSKIEYPSLEEAKGAVFEVIESGKLHKYLDKHRIKYPVKK